MKVQFLGWEDPLEKEMATHYSILAWKMPWLEKAGELQSTGSQRVGHNQWDPTCIDARFFSCGSSAPVSVECEGRTATRLVGTLAAQSVPGHRLSPPQELWPYLSLFSSLL